MGHSHKDIYVNQDFVKKQRKRENVISEMSNSRRRCCRLAILCLGLLNVLLMAAIALLWVKFTAERDQLQTSYDNLTIERDQLQTSYGNLTIERDQLQTSYDNLTTEREQLQASHDNCIIERCQLQAEKDGYQRELSEHEIYRNKLGWRYFSCSIYYISTDKKSWTDSRQHCKNRGADLVTINSREEQGFVDMLRGHQKAWIGLTFQDAVSWNWTEGLALTTPYWKHGEPNGLNEHCVASGEGSEAILNWADYPCDHQFVWICEKRIFCCT